jgi:hypothetical protein
LRNSAPKSFDGLELQLFMIPTEQSNMANYLAKYDAWYARHVAHLCSSIASYLPTITNANQGIFPNNIEL